MRKASVAPRVAPRIPNRAPHRPEQCAAGKTEKRAGEEEHGPRHRAACSPKLLGHVFRSAAHPQDIGT